MKTKNSHASKIKSPMPERKRSARPKATKLLQNPNSKIDIADRKNIEDALKREKAFNNRIINSISDTLYVFDPATGKAIFWNKAMSKMSGYTDAEIAEIPAVSSKYYDKKTVENLKKVRLLLTQK